MTTELAIHAIRIDGGTQSRAGIDPETLAEYVEALNLGASFPDVVVFHDGKSYWLVDGFHRVEAFKTLGRKKIAVEIKQGSLEDAQWFSCGANSAHGLKRTNADKRRAVEMAISHPKSKGASARAIAAHVGVDDQLVRRALAEAESGAGFPHLEKRLGRDGKTYPARRLTRSEPTAHQESEAPPESAATQTAEPETETDMPPKTHKPPIEAKPVAVAPAPVLTPATEESKPPTLNATASSGNDDIGFLMTRLNRMWPGLARDRRRTLIQVLEVFIQMHRSEAA